ncbi:MAG: tetratricopeptide repeat protein [Nitrospirae bacterium]|nr:tetratricopeptide repeat protein [Nitrospirota bacterium]
MPDERDIAIELMKQNKFQEALQIFLWLLEKNADDWSIYYMTGQCYRFTNRFPEAVNYLTEAASLNPADPQIFLALGIALQLTENYELAIEKLEQALRLEPRLVLAYNSIGLTYRKLGSFRKAIEWYDKAAECIVSLVSEEVHKDRAKCYRDAIVDGKKVAIILPYVLEKTHEMLRSDPAYAIVMNNIGVCLIELGDIDAASEKFRESIEFIPNGYNFPDPFKNLESIS